MSKSPLCFIFENELLISADRSKVEGYLVAHDSLVDRLMQQTPPLGEDEVMDNINFYPVYDFWTNTVTLEGHYYLEDGRFAVGKDFTIPLSKEESEQLIHDFEVYCQCTENKSLNEFVLETCATNSFEPLLKGDESFRYQMLSRMKTDCEYFLGAGCHSPHHLWAGNVDDHIAIMKALWNSFPKDKKPEWLSREALDSYEQEMKMTRRPTLNEQIRFAAARGKPAPEETRKAPDLEI